MEARKKVEVAKTTSKSLEEVLSKVEANLANTKAD